MSRRAAAPVVVPFGRATAEELAEALGLHRNTVSAYLREGAPAGPPYDEMQWRVWLAAKGRPSKHQPERELLEVLAATGVPEYVRLLAGGAAPPAAAAVRGGAGAAPSLRDIELDPYASPEQQKQVNGYLDAQAKLLELRVKNRQLVPRDALDGIVDALAGICIGLFNGLPEIAGEFTAHVEDQERLRQLLVARSNAARAALRTCAKTELARLLTIEAP